MSLVGPRAERIENVDFYCERMPEFRYRMKVKAGLTGYAQIYGKYNTNFEDKLKLDMLYIENCSLIHDLQLMFMTIKVVFMPESTERIRYFEPDGSKRTGRRLRTLRGSVCRCQGRPNVGTAAKRQCTHSQRTFDAGRTERNAYERNHSRGWKRDASVPEYKGRQQTTFAGL